MEEILGDIGIFVILVYIAYAILWAYSLIKTLTSEFIVGNNKLIWIVILLLLPPSAILFPFIGLKQIKIKEE